MNHNKTVTVARNHKLTTRKSREGEAPAEPQRRCVHLLHRPSGSFALPKMVPNTILHRHLPLILVVCCIALSGCATARSMAATVRQRDPMAGAPRLHNVDSPSMDELVAHLNRNTEKVASWQANRITIHTKGISVPLQGRLVVERGRHVRLEVTSPRGVELDVGSNDVRFWVWSRDMGPQIITCKHENTEIVRQTEGIPFEPDWLMEVLSVAPISMAGLTLDVSPAGDMARLERKITSPHGRPLRREIMVDLKKGGVICEHSLYDNKGARLALARLSSYVHDKPSGAFLPHRIVLDCPQNQTPMTVTMDLGKVNINPKSIPLQVWTMPDRPDCDIVNLDKYVRELRVSEALGDPETGDEAVVSEDEEMELPNGGSGVAGRARITNDDEPADSEPTASESDDELVDSNAGKAKLTAFSDDDLPR